MTRKVGIRKIDTEKVLAEQDIKIVYDNTFNSVILKGLSKNEHNMLMTLICLINEQQNEAVKINFSKLKKILSLNEVSKLSLSMWSKVSQANYEQYERRSGGVSSKAKVPLFSEFKVSNEGRYITVKVSDGLTYFFNDLENGNCSCLSLREFLKVRNRYGKRLYQYLSQFSSTGRHTVSRKELMEQLDVPEDCTLKKFNYNILGKVVKTIDPLFDSLNVGQEGKGRRTDRYTFTYQPK